nr:hypothetical protein [Tanacetum cinerariifolium]
MQKLVRDEIVSTVVPRQQRHNQGGHNHLIRVTFIQIFKGEVSNLFESCKVVYSKGDGMEQAITIVWLLCCWNLMGESGNILCEGFLQHQPQYKLCLHLLFIEVSYG